MDTVSLSRTNFGSLFVKAIAGMMESSLRYRVFPAETILRAAGRLEGKMVLEVGCGTGYFTATAARAVGSRGTLLAMDVLDESVAAVAGKVKKAQLDNVTVIKGDVLRTGLTDESVDVVLLFGMIPAPMLPMDKMMAELGRILRRNGTLAVWPPVPGWLRRNVTHGSKFQYQGKKDGVTTFSRLP